MKGSNAHSGSGGKSVNSMKNTAPVHRNIESYFPLDVPFYIEN